MPAPARAPPPPGGGLPPEVRAVLTMGGGDGPGARRDDDGDGDGEWSLGPSSRASWPTRGGGADQGACAAMAGVDPVNATIVGWHIPGAYDATLTSGPVHVCEHAMFFFTGVLFWARVIDPGPLRHRLVWPVRIAYAAGAMLVDWMLAVALVLVPHPIYAFYAALKSRPGGISALTDHQIAAGVMWVLGPLAYATTFVIGFYCWLDPDRSRGEASTALTT